ncbi:MAG TPA: hypothetical protein VJW77_00830 [Terriglobia bacterium]|nr:hypothetical protein [Terriglobia bacterium]
MPNLHSDKIEVQHQWDNDPCGANSVTDVSRETLEYYRAIRMYRYEVYAPRIPDAMEFAGWKDSERQAVRAGSTRDDLVEELFAVSREYAYVRLPLFISSSAFTRTALIPRVSVSVPH